MLTPTPEQLERCRELAIQVIGDDLGSPPESVVCKWARSLIKRSGQVEPPFKLELVLKSLNAEVRAVPLSNGARLLYRHNRSTILVKKDINQREQRLSIAHECAHIVFRKAVEKRIDDVKLQRAVFRWGSSSRQEQLCDRLAEEMLMPLSWVRATASSSRGLWLAQRLSADFEVGVWPAMRRMTRAGLPYLLVFWAVTPRPTSTEKLRTVWRRKPIGIPLPYIAPFRTVPPQNPITSVQIDGRPRKGWIDLSAIGLGLQNYYWSELLATSDGVLGIIDLGVTENDAGDAKRGGEVQVISDERLTCMLSELSKKELRSAERAL